MNEVVCVHVCISCKYDWMFTLAMFMPLCVGDVVCVGHGFYLCLWCWSARFVYVEVWVIGCRLVKHHF